MSVKTILNSEGAQLSVLGDRQLIKLTGKDTNGQLTVIMQELPAGIQVPKHVHLNEDENFHVIEGELEFEVGNEFYRLRSGDMIFLPRNIPHGIRVIGSKDAKVRLNIVPSGVEDMFAELDLLPAGPPDLEKVTEICGRYGVSFV